MYEPLKLSGRLPLPNEKSLGPPVVRELDVNALNFCRFAIASLDSQAPKDAGLGKGKEKAKEGILVIPSLLDSEYVRLFLHCRTI